MWPQILAGFESLLYKIACLAVGLAFCYMGYRLFLAGFKKAETDLEYSEEGKRVIKLTKIAPGTCFSIFGAAIIVVTIAKGWSSRGK
jgi:hypothetical protein